jgi:hypothetical protein
MMLSLEYCMVVIEWEISTHDLFMSFIVSNSGMYEELGRKTMHVVHGSGAVVFHMESGDVLRVKNVPWVPGRGRM